jgi:hypothetical protein
MRLGLGKARIERGRIDGRLVRPGKEAQGAVVAGSDLEIEHELPGLRFPMRIAQPDGHAIALGGDPHALQRLRFGQAGPELAQRLEDLPRGNARRAQLVSGPKEHEVLEGELPGLAPRFHGRHEAQLDELAYRVARQSERLRHRA